MSAPTSLVIGRDAECDVVLEHPTVSSRHARLVLTGSGLVLEDLGSTNGTYLDEARVGRARVERGSNVRIGDVILPWSDPKIVAFTKRFAARGTMVMKQVEGAAPVGAKPRSAPRHRGLVRAATVVLMVLATSGVAFAVYVLTQSGAPTRVAIPGTDASIVVEPDDHSIEGIIRRTRAPSIVAAIDATDPLTRNTAVKIAAGDEGPFHVEQVARIWTHVRGRWKYVNDPRGNEYFAKASETITNEYAGDCDDFATVLVAMITAIGGEGRVVVMNSPEGGHAYAEACIRMDPSEVATRLGRYYRRKWDPYLGRQRVERIHYRSSEACPLWLNLDWSAGVPGGPYVNEEWAVSVGTTGTTETLTPGRADTPSATTPTRTPTPTR